MYWNVYLYQFVFFCCTPPFSIISFLIEDKIKFKARINCKAHSLEVFLLFFSPTKRKWVYTYTSYFIHHFFTWMRKRKKISSTKWALQLNSVTKDYNVYVMCVCVCPNVYVLEKKFVFIFKCVFVYLLNIGAHTQAALSSSLDLYCFFHFFHFQFLFLLCSCV